MRDALRSLDAWIRLAGFVLVIAVLGWAQALLVPIALAVLLTFVLTPPVAWLQRRIGRVASVLIVVIVVFSVLGLAAYVVFLQMDSLGNALPGYRANIRQKIRDVRGAGAGGSVEKLQRTVEEIKGEFEESAPPPGRRPQPVVAVEQPAGFAPFAWLGPLVGPLGHAGFVVALVLFMLLERERLRDRVIYAIGHGRLALTTKAMVEAGRRVSRQLLLQTLVNLIYGALASAGLYVLGVPYPLFWGVFGAVLRFIPYVGPMVAAGAPILLALAALPGWTGPIMVVAFYVALELFTNLVLETFLYAGAAGISEVTLLIAVAFWTWLWGPFGLAMAVPLTVCIVVIGKHVPALAFLDTLLSKEPALGAEGTYYQRVLAGDEAEAAELVDRFLKAESPERVYDGLLIPALGYAERDRHEERLSPGEEIAVAETTRDMLDLLENGPSPTLPTHGRIDRRLRLLGYAANGTTDELALGMLRQILRGMPIDLEMASSRLLTSELVAEARAQKADVVCIADLPPSPPSKTRYLVKRLRAALPDVRILVGRWGPADLQDESAEALTEAGASHVASLLVDTRNHLAEAVHIAARAAAPAPECEPG